MSLDKPIEHVIERERVIEREDFTLAFTELIRELMQDNGVSRKELAKKLTKLWGYKIKETHVDILLNGEDMNGDDLDVGYMSDIALVLGYRLKLSATKL